MKANAAPPTRWEWHYRTLSRLRDLLRQERGERSAAFREPVARGGEDVGDVATGQSEHAELIAELHAEEAELAEVEAALERIRNGSYGICEATGDPIGPTRLRAVPWTRLSGEAAARIERTKASLLA
ncbi:MAG TPA: TraR/DksA C4-type zinc finger protein [Opitutaceae bacterium]|nr:TraR/DksA C4-type zinc finger protein [Opitutaceae bacterium]